MTVSWGYPTVLVTLTFAGKQMEKVESFEYLNISIYSDMSCGKYIESCSEACKTIQPLWRFNGSNSATYIVTTLSVNGDITSRVSKPMCEEKKLEEFCLMSDHKEVGWDKGYKDLLSMVNNYVGK